MHSSTRSVLTPSDTCRVSRRYNFSVLSLNASGYGDIIPLSGAARMLVMAQQTTGMFYVAILISRLASLYSTKESGRSS